MSSNFFVHGSDRVTGFSHLWAEFVAHMLDDMNTPWTEANTERLLRDRLEVTGLKHQDGRWFMVSVDTHRLEQYITGQVEMALSATIVGSIYEVHREALVDLMVQQPEAWPDYQVWIEDWEYGIGLRTDRPARAAQIEAIKQKNKQRRFRIRRGKR